MFIYEIESCTKHKALVQFVKKKKIAMLTRTKTVFESNNDFIIHGNLWTNNLLFNDSGDCKMVD
jgi:uncharacterized protein YxjI